MIGPFDSVGIGFNSFPVVRDPSLFILVGVEPDEEIGDADSDLMAPVEIVHDDRDADGHVPDLVGELDRHAEIAVAFPDHLKPLVGVPDARFVFWVAVGLDFFEHESFFGPFGHDPFHKGDEPREQSTFGLQEGKEIFEVFELVGHGFLLSRWLMLHDGLLYVFFLICQGFLPGEIGSGL